MTGDRVTVEWWGGPLDGLEFTVPPGTPLVPLIAAGQTICRAPVHGRHVIFTHTHQENDR